MSDGPAITLGSVVRLKSGGPKMTVTWVNPSPSVPPEVTCRWCLEGQTESNAITLPIAALELCAEEPKQFSEAEAWKKNADYHAAAQHEAEACVQRLAGALQIVVFHLTEGICEKNTEADNATLKCVHEALASVPAHLLAKEEVKS